jgi:hypothetical protein
MEVEARVEGTEVEARMAPLQVMVVLSGIKW